MSKMPFDRRKERAAYIMVDVETAGPNPSGYALLSIGACTLAEPRKRFYVELQPDRDAADAGAMQVNQLSLDDLRLNGLPPAEALSRFEAWLGEAVDEGQPPVFVAFNAPFDWMFVNDYFHRYLGHNPFGHNALDMRAFYMVVHGLTWAKASLKSATLQYLGERGFSHHALHDAEHQAEIFEKLLEESERLRASND